MGGRKRSTQFLLAALGSLLSVKFNSQELSPFDTNPVIMNILVLDLIVYAMALKKKNEVQSYAHKIITHRILHMASTLAVLLLALLLIWHIGWSLFGFWIVLQAWETYKSFKEHKLAFDEILSSLAGIFRRGAIDGGHAVEEEPNQSPV